MSQTARSYAEKEKDDAKRAAKQQSAGPAAAATATATAATDGGGSDDPDLLELGEEYRMARVGGDRPVVGPGTYTPQLTLTHPQAPKSTFGRQHRFLPSKVGYISPRHNSDLLCTASPGPKYGFDQPQLPTQRRAPALTWGSPDDNSERKERELGLAAAAAASADVGPASYKPRARAIKPTAPRASFGKWQRFPQTEPFVSRQHNLLTTSFDKPGPKYDINERLVHPEPPQYSFGAKKPPRNRANLKTDRSSFLTHSIKGGLAKPATLECSIGSADYSPRYEFVAPTGPQYHLSRAKRFIRAGTQFISSHHCAANAGVSSPGPKYYDHHLDLSYKPKTARSSGLKWVP